MFKCLMNHKTDSDFEYRINFASRSHSVYLSLRFQKCGFFMKNSNVNEIDNRGFHPHIHLPRGYADIHLKPKKCHKHKDQ